MSDPAMPPGAPFGMDTYARQMAQKAQQTADTATSAAVGSAVRTCRFSSGKLTALLTAGSSVDVTVVWKTAMPSTAYTVEVVDGPGIVGVPAYAVKSKTTTQCVITVTATLAIAAGGFIYAHCFSN